jgi:hypothetical protein
MYFYNFIFLQFLILLYSLTTKIKFLRVHNINFFIMTESNMDLLFLYSVVNIKVTYLLCTILVYTNVEDIGPFKIFYFYSIENFQYLVNWLYGEWQIRAPLVFKITII